jgi:hypothetical protein
MREAPSVYIEDDTNREPSWENMEAGERGGWVGWGDVAGESSVREREGGKGMEGGMEGGREERGGALVKLLWGSAAKTIGALTSGVQVHFTQRPLFPLVPSLPSSLPPSLPLTTHLDVASLPGAVHRAVASSDCRGHCLHGIRGGLGRGGHRAGLEGREEWREGERGEDVCGKHDTR